jgi:TetR/AcrR family transcriptional repressor of bet genes
MAATPLSKIRRLELQKAAFETARECGFNDLTVQKVASHAGISKGIVHHYFDSKHQLVEYAARYAHKIVATAARRKLRMVRSPSDRVWALMEANFLPEILTPEFFRLWFEVLDNERLLYLFDIFEHRMRSNLIFALRPLVGSKAGAAAYDIMNFYDGFYVLASVDASITRETMLTSIAEYIKVVVPEFDLNAVRLHV